MAVTAKSYSGCWTCRRRHVRCDERKPLCLRCERAHLKCEGYAVALNWINPDVAPSGRRMRRRCPVSTRRSWPVINSSQIQNELDALAELHGEGRKGLFSVFLVLRPHSNLHTSPREPNPQNGLKVWDEAESLRFRNQDIRLAPQLHGFAHVASGRELEEHPVRGESLELNQCSVGSLSLNYHDVAVSPMVEPREWRTPTENPLTNNLPDGRVDEEISSSVDFTSALQRKSPLLVRHLDECEQPSNVRRLLHHWVTHLGSSLMPIHSAENLMISVFLPMALKGLQHPSSISSSFLALFHAICALSASNLASLKGNDVPLLDLATKHRTRSFTYLRLNLSSTNEDQGTIALLGTIILHLTESSTHGISHEWRHHIQGGNRLLKSAPPGLWTSSTSASMVCQVFRFINAVAGYHDFPPDFTSTPNDLDQDVSYIKDALGIPASLLTAFHKIQALRGTASYSDADLDRIEIELYLSAPPPTESNGTTREDQQSIHRHIFYYSILIYFKRLTGRYSGQELEELALAGWEYVSSLNGTSRYSPVTWPIIVIACEIRAHNSRRQILEWLSHRRRSGFAVYQRAQNLLARVWSDRDSKKLDIRWHTLLSAVPEFDIFWG